MIYKYSLLPLILLFTLCKTTHQIDTEQANERVEKLEESIADKPKAKDGSITLTETETTIIMQELKACRLDRKQDADAIAEMEDDAATGRTFKKFRNYVIGGAILALLIFLFITFKPKLSIG